MRILVIGGTTDTDVFVLLHSPLVGPFTWSLVAKGLRRRGIEVVVPVLHDDDSSGLPYWRRHVASAIQVIASLPEDRAPVLVGHSGTGPLLPTIGESCGRHVGAYLFVDAALPLDGQSRLDDMEADDPEFARQLRQHLVAGGRFPDWSEEDLRAVIPNDRLRRDMVAELRLRPLAFFQERIPGSVADLDAPCAYLRFSDPYAQAGARARQAGWAYRELDAEHFHMLVDPATVADTLLKGAPRFCGKGTDRVRPGLRRRSHGRLSCPCGTPPRMKIGDLHSSGRRLRSGVVLRDEVPGPASTPQCPSAAMRPPSQVGVHNFKVHPLLELVRTRPATRR